MNNGPERGSPQEINLSGVTRENLLEKFGGFEDLMLESIKIFLDDAPLRISDIKKAVNSGDAENLAVSAHTLKGSLGYFDEGVVYKSALDLEQAGRNGALKGVDMLFKDLMNGMEALVKRLKEISAA